MPSYFLIELELLHEKMDGREHQKGQMQGAKMGKTDLIKDNKGSHIYKLMRPSQFTNLQKGKKKKQNKLAYSE